MVSAACYTSISRRQTCFRWCETAKFMNKVMDSDKYILYIYVYPFNTRGIVVWLLAGARDFCLLWSIQSCSVAQPTSYSVVPLGSFHKHKHLGHKSDHSLARLRMSGCVLPLSYMPLWFRQGQLYPYCYHLLNYVIFFCHIITFTLPLQCLFMYH
jgi:hypothetical protein